MLQQSRRNSLKCGVLCRSREACTAYLCLFGLGGLLLNTHETRLLLPFHCIHYPTHMSSRLTRFGVNPEVDIPLYIVVYNEMYEASILMQGRRYEPRIEHLYNFKEPV